MRNVSIAAFFVVMLLAPLVRSEQGDVGYDPETDSFRGVSSPKTAAPAATNPSVKRVALEEEVARLRHVQSVICRRLDTLEKQSGAHECPACKKLRLEMERSQAQDAVCAIVVEALDRHRKWHMVPENEARELLDKMESPQPDAEGHEGLHSKVFWQHALKEMFGSGCSCGCGCTKCRCGK